MAEGLIYEEGREIVGMLCEQDIKLGQQIENLWASERNPTRRGIFRGFKKKRSVTGWRSSGIRGNTAHFTDIVVMDTPGGRVYICNNKESKWRVWG